MERYPEAAKAFEAERPGVVHRLDKDTTGVLLMAKTPQAQAFVSQAFEERRTTKTYLAIVEGVPTRPRAVIDAPLGRHPGDRTRMAIVNDGREARTEYELLGSGQDLSLLLVHLYTGRTHQIRVHLSAIGHPVSGDVVYGTRETRTAARGAAGVAPSQVGVRKSQLLHAWQLRVPHPDGGTLIATAPLPADMGDVLRANGMTVLAQEYGRSLGGRILPDASEAEPDEEA